MNNNNNYQKNYEQYFSNDPNNDTDAYNENNMIDKFIDMVSHDSKSNENKLKIQKAREIINNTLKVFNDKTNKVEEYNTPEELDKISNDLATKLSPKFVKYKLELDRDEDAPEKNAAAFMVPLDSFVAFLQAFVLKA